MGVMKDDAKCMAVAGTHPAHPMAQVDPIAAARTLHRPMAYRKNHAIPLAKWHDLDVRLHARPLLRKDEFTSCEVVFRHRE